MRFHLFSIFHSSLLNFAISYLYFVFLNVLVNIQMSRHEITFKRSSQLKTRILIFRPTRLYTVFFPPPSLLSVLLDSPAASLSTSLCVPCVLYPPLLLFALFLTAVPSAECLRCALWQCSLCISDSWVRASVSFCLLGSSETSRIIISKQTQWFEWICSAHRISNKPSIHSSPPLIPRKPLIILN